VSGRTIDVSRGTWGHNITVSVIHDGGQRLDVTGWLTPQPDEGDFLILANGEGTTRYKVDEIRPCFDPKDMFFAALTFAPRTTGEAK
jgi:hypothetical protein